MRILVLANVPPDAVGGAEVQAWQLARHWAGAGHEVTVAGYANLPRLEAGVSVVRIATWRASRVTRAASYALSTARLLWRRRRSVDLVYCRFLGEHALVASAARFAGVLKAPVVACPACASAQGDVAILRRSPLFALMRALLMRGLTGVNAISTRIADEVGGLGFPARSVARIPNGVDVPDDLPTRPPGEVLKLLFVGRLVHQKGVDVLLEALARLPESGSGLELRIVGDGPLRAELTALAARLRLSQRVRFDGGLPPESMARAYREADALVLPSRYEGMPGVVLEAIAQGLPVVATEVSGSEDIVEPGVGWVVPPDDPEALTRALSEAIAAGPDGLRRKGRAAHRLALERYHMARVAQQNLDWFEALLARPRQLGTGDPGQ